MSECWLLEPHCRSPVKATYMLYKASVMQWYKILCDSLCERMQQFYVALPWPASAQSTVKYVGSKALRPVLATPGPDTFTLFGWQPAPIFIWDQKHNSLRDFSVIKCPLCKPSLNICLCTYPEWAVRDVDSSPGDHGSVFYRLTWGVSTGVCAVAIILNLYIHRSTFSILCRCEKTNKTSGTDQSEGFRTWGQRCLKGWNRTRRSDTCKISGHMLLHTQPYLSHNLKRGFSSLLGINCELGGLSNSQTTALKAWTIRLNLEETHSWSFRKIVIHLQRYD